VVFKLIENKKGFCWIKSITKQLKNIMYSSRWKKAI